MEPSGWVLVVTFLLSVVNPPVPVTIDLFDRDGLPFRSEASCNAYKRDLRTRLPIALRQRASFECKGG